MGMLGMLDAEVLEISDMMIWKQQEEKLLFNVVPV